MKARFKDYGKISSEREITVEEVKNNHTALFIVTYGRDYLRIEEGKYAYYRYYSDDEEYDFKGFIKAYEVFIDEKDAEEFCKKNPFYHYERL